jgi:hypothetical protein
LCIVFFSSFNSFHPFYLSVTEVKIDTKNGIISISCRIFTDDLQEVIYKLYQSKSSLDEYNSEPNQEILNKYLQQKIKILVNGKEIKLKMKGYENEEESTWCHFEGRMEGAASEIIIYNSILYDFLPDQSNIIHCYLGKERKSLKLKNPEEKALFQF